MSDTPETDAAIKEQSEWKLPFVSTTMDGVTYDGPVASLCRRMERERDRARKLAEEFHRDQVRLLIERDDAREQVAELSAVVKRLRAIMRQEAQAAEKKIKEAHEIAFHALIQRDEILKAMAI
jgi:GTP1/Obg family GTP-binding protein